MDVLLRQLRPGPDGAIEYQDIEVSADELSVGASADCTLQLLGEGVSAHHAMIRIRGTQLTLLGLKGAKVRINGALRRAAALQPGDLIEIGGHRVRVVDPPAGFDCGLEVDPDLTVSPSAYERAFRTELSMTWLSRRTAAWVLAFLVLVLAMAIPYASIAPQRAGKTLTPFLPSDQWWSAGPLIPAHELAAGKHCISCHQQQFVHVRDEACRECHRDIADHVTHARLAQTQLGPAARCAQCHEEHHAPMSGLVIRDNGLCVDCHAKSESRFGSLKVQPVSGFTQQAHPAFTVSLIKPGGTLQEDGLPQWIVSRETIGQAREQSNLKFSHSQHLDPAQVTRASDRGQLGCSDCHTLDADGEHFVPVTMQRSCSSCHELTFDPSAPERQLPHGKPRDAILLVQDYFVRKALDPNPAASGFQRRRRPDQPSEAAATVCNDSGFNCALRRAQAEVENQFTDRGCVTCHEVTDNHAKDLLARFQVRPVRLTRDYFPKVRFNHRLHAVQKDKSGDEACLACHPVKPSTSSADLFIPDLPKCLECHSDQLTTDRVTLQCASCHRYHPITTIEPRGEADAK